MGGAASQAMSESDAKMRNMIGVLMTKRDQYLAEIAATRGSGRNLLAEVAGGRTVARHSEIRVKQSSGFDEAISSAIGDFIDCASGGADVKAKAVSGAKKLITSGLAHIFGASEGQTMEERKFICMFMNYAFVRVDFCVYTYCASGKKWGMVESISGACFVTDTAVLNAHELTSSEQDFLLAQSTCGAQSLARAARRHRPRRLLLGVEAGAPHRAHCWLLYFSKTDCKTSLPLV